MTENGSTLVGRVESALSAMSEGNFEKFGDLLAEDIVYHLTGQHQFSGKYEGRQSLLNLLAGVTSTFRDGIDYTINRAIAADNTVITTFTGNGTTLNGKSYRNEYCSIWDFDGDGQIIHITEFFDSHHVTSVIPLPA